VSLEGNSGRGSNGQQEISALQKQIAGTPLIEKRGLISEATAHSRTSQRSQGVSAQPAQARKLTYSHKETQTASEETKQNTMKRKVKNGSEGGSSVPSIGFSAWERGHAMSQKRFAVP